MDSKSVSWKWLTASELLCHGACELIYAKMVADEVTADTILYNGENVTEVPIVNLQNGAKSGDTFNPPIPVYCQRGLYVNCGDSNITGIFVMWRELGR